MRQLSGNAVSAVHPMWIQAWRMGSISSYCEAMLSLPFSMWTPHPHHWWGEFLPCPLKTLLAEHVNSMTSKTIPSVLQVASRPWPWRQCVRQLGMHAMHSPLAVNYANRIVRTSGVWCSLRVFYGSYKCVCVWGPDSCHLPPGPCPDQGCQSFRGACFSPKPLPTDIVRKHTVTQCMYYDPDLIWPYGQNIVTWQHLYSFVKYTDTCWTNDLVIFTYHSQPTPFDGDGLILFVGKPQRVGITCVLHFSFGQKYY